MKNREKYNDFLVDAMSVRGYSFGVDKKTGEPKVCASFDSYTAYNVNCEECAFYEIGTPSCLACRKKWLNEECDPWLEFKSLKKGDLILIKKGLSMYPYIFVSIEDDGLTYAAFIGSDGSYSCLMKEINPNLVRRLE